MVLVIGATGLLGYEVCRRLRARGKPVRTLVKNHAAGERVRTLREAGVELCPGDMNDGASLAACCHDVQAVIATVTSTAGPADDSHEQVDRRGLLNLVEFAHAIGVPRFVLIATPRRFRTDCELARTIGDVSYRLEKLRMQHVVLCANYLMEAWLSPRLGFDYANARATIYGPGTRPIAWVSHQDVAEMAVRSAEGEVIRDHHLEAGGPENLSPLDVVRIFEEVSGRSFAVQHVPETDLESAYRGAGDPAGRTLAALKLEYARGCPTNMTATLARMPIALTSVRDYAHSAIAPKAAAM